MIQIIKLTYNDDSYGTTDVEVMVCSSFDAAKEVILNVLNKDFEGSWKSLDEVAEELSEELTSASWDEEEKAFHWYEDGKGESYIIGRVNERKGVNVEFQNFGVIG